MTMNNKRDKVNSWIAQIQCVLGELKRLKAAANRLEDDITTLRDAIVLDQDIISTEMKGDRWKAIERNHK
jgi:hypothetical protein